MTASVVGYLDEVWRASVTPAQFEECPRPVEGWNTGIARQQPSIFVSEIDECDDSGIVPWAGPAIIIEWDLNGEFGQDSLTEHLRCFGKANTLFPSASTRVFNGHLLSNQRLVPFLIGTENRDSTAETISSGEWLNHRRAEFAGQSDEFVDRLGRGKTGSAMSTELVYAERAHLKVPEHMSHPTNMVTVGVGHDGHVHGVDAILLTKMIDDSLTSILEAGVNNDVHTLATIRLVESSHDCIAGLSSFSNGKKIEVSNIPAPLVKSS